MPQKYFLEVRAISGRNLISADSNGLSDPYIVISVLAQDNKKRRAKTKVIKKTLNPDWNQVFTFTLHNPDTDIVHFRVMDKDLIGSDFLGEVDVPVGDLEENLEKSIKLTLKGVDHGEIYIGLKAINWSGSNSLSKQSQSQVQDPRFSPQPTQYYHQPAPISYNFPSQVNMHVHASSPYGAVPFCPPQGMGQTGGLTQTSSPILQTSHSAAQVGESANREGYNISYSEIRFLKKIGAGAFGEVWKGEWAGTDIAIKKILATDISESDLAEFSDEILMMSKLRHPNIVQFLGACMEPEFCLLTEFMDKGSLFDVLADKSIEIDWNLKLRFASDVAKGLFYLHSRTPPIIHRDVKSLNVLVTKDWKSTIADFGLTKMKDKSMLSTRCGSPAWSAPEVLRGESYDERADVFSYGIVLWEIATREPPYKGMNPMQVIGQVAYQKPCLRPPIPDQCPDGYINLMTRCWDDKTEVRPTFCQIVEELKTIISKFQQQPELQQSEQQQSEQHQPEQPQQPEQSKQPEQPPQPSK